MKKLGYLFVLIGALLLVGCEMPFPDTGEVTEETVGQPTAVSDPNATPLPDNSGSADPNVGGGAPNAAPATDEPTAEPVEATVEPTQTAVPPTATSVPPTETAVSPTIAPTPTTEPTTVPIPPEEPQRTHTVAPGENLYRISLQYGLSWTEVATANGITNPDSIVVGQVLIIPTN